MSGTTSIAERLHEAGRKIAGAVGDHADTHEVIVTRRRPRGRGSGEQGGEDPELVDPEQHAAAEVDGAARDQLRATVARIASPVPDEPMPRAIAQVTPATAAAATTTRTTVDASRRPSIPSRSRWSTNKRERRRRRSRRARTRARARGCPATRTAETPTRC